MCVERRDAETLWIGKDRDHCDEAEISTGYAYAQYQADPESPQTYVDGLADLATSTINGPTGRSRSLDRLSLVVAIRPDAYIQLARSNDDVGGFLWRPFAGDLVAILMQDSPEEMRSVRPEDLDALGLTEKDAWSLALENIRAKIGPLQRSTADDGVALINADSGLATSLLWLPENCRQDGPGFDVLVVARDAYFVADHSSPAAIQGLENYARRLSQSGEEMYSRAVLSCTGGKWAPAGDS